MLLSPEKNPGLTESFLTSSRDDPAAVKDVLLVGATVGPDGRLSTNDRAWAHAFARFLRERKIPLHPDSTFSAVDLNKGEDFLRDSFAAGAVGICFVANPPATQQRLWGGRQAVSPRHFEPGIWPGKVLKAGAEALMVAGGTGEINQSHFEKPDGELRLVQRADVLDLSFFLHRNYAARSAPAAGPR